MGASGHHEQGRRRSGCRRATRGPDAHQPVRTAQQQEALHWGHHEGHQGARLLWSPRGWTSPSVVHLSRVPRPDPCDTHSVQPRQDKLSNYEDAQTEMMLLDDDEGVRYAVGDTYSQFDADTANEMLEAEIEDLQQQLEKQQELMTETEEQMSDLKTL